LIDPAKLAHVFLSPRKRAQATFDLLFEGAVGQKAQLQHVTTTDELAEWDYGKYEGLLTGEIRERRMGQGLDRQAAWDVWRDGCEGGEFVFQSQVVLLSLFTDCLGNRTAQQVTDRLDGLIRKIHDIQRPYMHGEKPADILLVRRSFLFPFFPFPFFGNIRPDTPIPSNV
jgi:sedoheptulose-bisphosphatase